MIEYVKYKGAVCNKCNTVLWTYRTMDEEEGTRIRYHKCRNVICSCFGRSIKSVETVKNIK